MKNKRFPYLLVAIVMLALVLLSLVYAITFGPVSIHASEVYRILVGKTAELLNHCLGTHFPLADTLETLKSSNIEIVWNIRFPRVLMAIFVGAGLSMSGVVMQAVVKNPLANPFTLGISSGASLGATMSIILGAFTFMGNYGTSFGAFIGSLLASLVVFVIAFSGTGRGNTVKLLLAGMAISAICSAFTSFIIYTASDAEGMRSVTFWTVGALTSSSWNTLTIPTIVVTVMSLFFLTQYRILNVMMMGEDSAITMGVDIVKMRKWYLVLTSIVTGVVVAATGTIGFVGLIVPHIVRMFVGPDNKKVMYISIFGGSIFLIWCDVFARMYLGSSELPIGIITSMIGGPFFISLMLTKNHGFGGD